DLPEDLTVRTPDFVPPADVEDVHAGPYDVTRLGAEPAQRLDHALQGESGLLVHVADRDDLALDGGRAAADVDGVTGPHRTAVADDGLPRRPRRDPVRGHCTPSTSSSHSSTPVS